MRKFLQLVNILITLIALSGIAYIAWHYGYREETSLVAPLPSGQTSNEVRAQGKLLGKLIFAPNGQNDCVVQDAWLEKISVITLRQWFGYRLQDRNTSIAMIYIVLHRTPESTTAPQFSYQGPAAATMLGANIEASNINEQQAWRIRANTPYPAPATFKFACGQQILQAQLVH